MDDLAFLHERIESYADYTNDRDRVLADEQIRAYVGVALAGVIERLEPPGVAGEELGRVLLRCEFADQRLVRAFDGDLDAPEVAAMRAVDRDLVSLADRADAIDAASVGAYIAQIDAVLDRRADILLRVGKPDPAR